MQLFHTTLICAFPCHFPSNFFVQGIKYNTELHFYCISVPIKDELSPQEVNLGVSFEMMSQHWVCMFSTDSEGNSGGRRWALAYGMGKVSSRLGVAPCVDVLHQLSKNFNDILGANQGI